MNQARSTILFNYQYFQCKIRLSKAILTVFKDGLFVIIFFLKFSTVLKDKKQIQTFFLWYDNFSKLLFCTAHFQQQNSQEFMRKDREFYNLHQLKKQVEKDIKSGKQPYKSLYCSIGVIIDCSNVYKYESNRDYLQKLKIIDSSCPQEPTQVYLWNNRRQDYTFNLKVGDILYFNKFKMDIYNGSLQAKKVYKVEDSYFRIFNGNPDKFQYEPIDRMVGLDDPDRKILLQINNLRTFSKQYFSSNKVPVLFKQDPKLKQQNKAVTSSDFDIILRVMESVETKNFFKILLTDERSQFHLNYPRKIQPGVYKIRSVANIVWQEKYCILYGNDYTFFLQISKWMRSYNPKQWQRLVPQSIKAKAKRNLIQTKILSTNKQLKRISLKQLFTRDEHTQQVIATIEVMDIITTYEDALKKYDAKNHTYKNKNSEVGEFIYSIHLLISDQSMGNQVCNAYIYTFDERGLEFLPELHPKLIYGRNTLNLKQNYDNFVNRLLEETDITTAPITVVLSPLFNGKQTIYRIVDTELLF